MLDPAGAEAPPTSVTDRDLRAVATSLDELVPSGAPAEVFAGLAGLSVPAFSDRCVIDLHEFGKPALRITRPDDGTQIEAAGRQLHTPIDSASLQPETGFTGLVVHTWSAGAASAADAAFAALMVRCAIATVAQARSVATAAAAATTAENLGIALRTSRRIGIAIGILMAAHEIGDEAAFDLLRTASQRTSRKLRDIAQDVIESGALRIE